MKTTLRRSIAASRNGPSGKRAGTPRKGSATDLRALRVRRQRAVGEQAGDAAFVEPAPQREHRVDAAERDRAQLALGCQRGERLVDEARVVLVHDHRDAQTLFVADHAQRLEAAEMGTEREHAVAARERHQDRVGAAGGEAELVEALLQQVDAVEHGRGEGMEMAVDVAPRRRPRQRAREVARRMAPRLGVENEPARRSDGAARARHACRA